MAQITIGIINKSLNSTSTTMQTSEAVTVRLKEPCSRHDPVFLLQSTSKSLKYNYLNWGDNYYWIDDIIYLTNDIIEIHCHLDPLGTYRRYIGETYAWINYGDAAHWNEDIDDLRFSPEIEDGYYENKTNLNSLIPFDFVNGTVLMTVLGTAGANKGIHTYAMSPDTYAELWTSLNQGTLDSAYSNAASGDWTAFLTDVVQDLASWFSGNGGGADWKDCIFSAIFVPIRFLGDHQHPSEWAQEGVVTNEMDIGSIPFLTHSTMYKLSVAPLYDGGTVNLAWNWQGDAANLKFLRNERWAKFQLATPNGYQDVSDACLKNDELVRVFIGMDVKSGQWVLKVSHQDPNDSDTSQDVIDTAQGCVARDVGWIIQSSQGESGDSSMIKGLFNIGKKIATLGMASNNKDDDDVSKSKTTTKKDNQNSGNDLTNQTTAEIAKETSRTGVIHVPLNTGINTSIVSCGVDGNNWASYFLEASNYNDRFIVMLKYKQWTFKDAAHYIDYCNAYGYPVNAYLQIQNMSWGSYVECAGAFVRNIPGATDGDKATINAYMNQGFLWQQ